MRDVFRKPGRRTKQYKRDVDAAATENTDYEYEESATRFTVKPEQCPDCWSKGIIPAETEEKTP